MKRAILMAISVLLALIVALPIASGQTSSQSQTIGKLTGDWWNWAVSTRPSPLNGGDPCGGNFVDGVFFLGGSFTIDPVTRTCTVPANTPILFPVVNTACSAAPTVQQPDGTFTGDPKPYTKCSKDLLDQTVLANSTMFATLNGQPLKIQRLESGPFTFTVPSPDGSEIVPNAPPGSYKSAASGFWVYLPQGLEPGTYTLHWGGSFANGGFTQDITYILTVVD